MNYQDIQQFERATMLQLQIQPLLVLCSVELNLTGVRWLTGHRKPVSLRFYSFKYINMTNLKKDLNKKRFFEI